MPKTIKYIIFGRKYNKQLHSNVIPNGTLEIVFGEDFNQPLLEGVLPKSIMHITISKNFKQKMVLSKNTKVTVV